MGSADSDGSSVVLHELSEEFRAGYCRNTPFCGIDSVGIVFLYGSVVNHQVFRSVKVGNLLADMDAGTLRNESFGVGALPLIRSGHRKTFVEDDGSKA